MAIASTDQIPLPHRREPLEWLNILRSLCAFEVLGFHWLRACQNLGILNCHGSLSVVSPYGNTGLGLAGFRLLYLGYCGPGLSHVFTALTTLAFGYGWEAVNVFIVISGFSLTLGLPANLSRRFWLRWYPRRLKRILLSYYLVALPYITVFLVFLNLHSSNRIIERLQRKLSGLFRGSLPNTYFTHIFLIDPHNRHWNVSFFSPAWWFIPAILVGYLFFPFFLRAALQWNTLLWLSGTLFVTVVSYALAASERILVMNGWYFVILNGAFCFASSIAVALAWKDERRRRLILEWLARGSTTALALAAFVLGNVLNLYHFTFPASSPLFTFGMCVLGAQLSMFLADSALSRKWRLAGRLASIDSLALYLVHQPLAMPVAILLMTQLGSKATFLGLPIYLLFCCLVGSVVSRLAARLSPPVPRVSRVAVGAHQSLE